MSAYRPEERKLRTNLRWILLQKLLEFSGTFTARIEPREEMDVGIERIALVL